MSCQSPRWWVLSWFVAGGSRVLCWGICFCRCVYERVVFVPVTERFSWFAWTTNWTWGNYTPPTLPHQAASGDDSPFTPMGGYLQLQNSLSRDISQCPMCLAKPSFVIRNSAIQTSQSVIIHHAMVKRGVVVVLFHSFLNLRNKWKLKTGYLRVRAALTLRKDLKILSGHSGEEKYVLYLAGKRTSGCHLVSHHYLDGPTPSIYVMSDEYWANVCNCCCGLPEGEGIFCL